jgi:hypothetical protein
MPSGHAPMGRGRPPPPEESTGLAWCAAIGASEAPRDDPRLAAVIDARDGLPEATRAAIVAMIGAASKE